MTPKNTPCLILLLFCAATVFAQATGSNTAGRTIEINVVDADLAMPLEGVTIIREDGSSVQGDEDGTVKLNIKNDKEIFIISYPGYETLRWTIPRQSGGAQGTQKSWSVSLRSTSTAQNKEIVFEEKRGVFAQETPGRGVTLSSKALDKSARIGLIEDALSAIKLLPGVGYAGMFDALPSIRGGEPGDLQAVFDGFYIDNPYHWAGVVSIFDPKMVERAELSHGVFEAAYGHTSSGLLEIESKRAALDFAEIEAGISTSAASLHVAVPFSTLSSKAARGSGGFSFFGKITYWDGFVWLVKGLSNFIESLEVVNAIETAPFIQAGGFNVNYRWNANLETIFNGYIGNDGVSVSYNKDDAAQQFFYDEEMHYKWNNLIAFAAGRIIFNPANNVVLRTSFGGAYTNSEYYMNIISPDASAFEDVLVYPTYNAQFRNEVDWQFNESFLFSAGIEEVYRGWQIYYTNNVVSTIKTNDGQIRTFPLYSPDVKNQGWFSSAWTILNWTNAKKKLNAEAGLRIDHLYFIAQDFSASAAPVFNPRFNLEYTAVSNSKQLNSLKLSAGSGLFSSINEELTLANSKNAIKDLKESRAWTSILGANAAFVSELSINIELYYKYIFDRTYSNIAIINNPRNEVGYEYHFNGKGHSGGIDLLLQKKSGLWTGWFSYSFNVTRYNNPDGMRAFEDARISSGGVWFYPRFHRFHNVNLVMNFDITKKISLYTRLGFATGAPLIEHNPIRYLYSSSEYRYYDDSLYSDSLRNVFNLPLDIKLSYNFFNKTGRAQGEVYIALENILVMVLPKQDTRIINKHTGKLEDSKDQPVYELPVPMVSFGFRWTY